MKSFAFAALLAPIAALLGISRLSADVCTIEVSHDLSQARPAETITIPWSSLAKALPGALLQKIAVKDAKGRVLPYQVTNVAPLAKDPKDQGIAYGDLIFQYDFAAGEKRAVFSVARIDEVAPVFPAKVFARYVPERLDDFAWENDKVAHRCYGPALAAPAPAGSGKEVLVTSGIDVWCKRVPYPIVDRWYNKGHDHYHKDEGEGMDMYQVGRTRGCGGTGVWDGKALHVGRNYASWKVIANGPVRAVFELTYDAWDASGIKVSEVKRYTVDAGHYLDRVDSTFTFTGAPELVVAVGLNKNCADKGQEPKVDFARDETNGILRQWTVQKNNGALGTAIVILSGRSAGFAEDAANALILARVKSGEPLRFLAGAGWSRAGDFPDRDAWDRYLQEATARENAPIRITLR